MSVGFIGAGQLACALARGFTAAGKRVEAGGGCAGVPWPGLGTASTYAGMKKGVICVWWGRPVKQQESLLSV